MKLPERLVHTFTHEWLKGVVSTCTWTLEPVENGTMLTLVHEGLPDLKQSADHDAGWDEHFIRLRRVVA
jgi:Activator of Hsp90 ATPase homolog 1-like protein